MSTPLSYDGATGKKLPSHGDPLATREDLSKDTPPTGFAEPAMDFHAVEAPVLPSFAAVSQRPLTLDESRRKVEDLLKDAGVHTPPSRVQLTSRTSEADVPSIAIERARTAQRFMPSRFNDRLFKRFFDLVGATLAIIVFAPLMGLISLALLAEGGPVLYRQTRVGRKRQRFNCVKFRTMRPDAEDRLRLLLACNDSIRTEWRIHQKLVDDPRVTRIGRMLRDSSLDELPQLINVLRGEMSLVGPRPIVAPEFPGYDADRAYYDSAAFEDYTACLPGITGLWQISGRHRTTYLDRVRLDRQYIRTWSFWLDLKILWKTVGVVLCGSGR